MLHNISFCSCCRLDADKGRETQCMFFNFTDRARKALSDDFLYQITESGPGEDFDKIGIPLSPDDTANGDRVFISKVDENTYRVPTRYMEPFIRCLFKYLPAFYVPNNDIKKNYYCTM